jgi:hypothetical protein
VNYIKKPFVLCAFNVDKATETNLLTSLGLQYKSVIGRYKGIDENSYMVLIEDKDDRHRLEVYLKKYSQESYLYVNEDRRSPLVFLDDKSTIELGRFSMVSPAEALLHDAFTLDVSTGLYYICN